MKLVRNDMDPVPRPEADAAQLIGDLKIESVVQVLVGGVVFSYERTEDGDWRRAGAFTAARGHAIDQSWFLAAQQTADREVRAGIEKLGGDEQVSDIKTCPECGRILCDPEIARRGDVDRIECGPAHALVYDGGARTLVVYPGGKSELLEASGG